MTLTVIDGGKRSTSPEDTATRRKQLRKIEYYAQMFFGRPTGPLPMQSLGPRRMLACGAAAAAGIFTVWAVGFGWLWLIANGAAYLAVTRYSTAPRSWGQGIDQRLADYDPLDKDAYKRLQSATDMARALEPWHFREWLDCEYLALDAADGIRHRPEDRGLFLKKKL